MIQPVDNDKGFVKKTKQRSARNNKQKLPNHKKVTKIKNKNSSAGKYTKQKQSKIPTT